MSRAEHELRQLRREVAEISQQSGEIAGSITSVTTPSIVPSAISKTLALTDAGTIQNITAVATITVPPNSSVAFPISTQIAVVNTSSADVTFLAGSGVTIRSKDANLKIDGQYASASLIKIATDEWLLVGSLKA